MIQHFTQDDTNLSAWLLIDGDEYELAQFNISFSQACDAKGEPQCKVRGGKMHLVFSQSLSENMYAWAIKSGLKKKGTVEFRRQSQSAALKVEFTDAYCVNFDRHVDAIGGGLKTSMLISPDEILINGYSFDNRWTS